MSAVLARPASASAAAARFAIAHPLASSSTADPSFNTGGSGLAKSTRYTGGTHGAPVPTSGGTAYFPATSPRPANWMPGRYGSDPSDLPPLPARPFNFAEGADNSVTFAQQDAMHAWGVRESIRILAEAKAQSTTKEDAATSAQTAAAAAAGGDFSQMGTSDYGAGAPAPTALYAQADELAPVAAAPYASPSQQAASSGPSPLLVIGGIGVAALLAWKFLR